MCVFVCVSLSLSVCVCVCKSVRLCVYVSCSSDIWPKSPIFRKTLTWSHTSLPVKWEIASCVEWEVCVGSEVTVAMSPRKRRQAE